MSYRSVTQEYIVTWTRDEAGKWWPDDFIERGCTTSDDDMLVNIGLDEHLHPDPADRVMTYKQSDDPAAQAGREAARAVIAGYTPEELAEAGIV